MINQSLGFVTGFIYENREFIGLVLTATLIHYISANLYVFWCTPFTIYGFMASPFITVSTHCVALRWSIWFFGDYLTQTWMLALVWASGFLIKNFTRKHSVTLNKARRQRRSREERSDRKEKKEHRSREERSDRKEKKEHRSREERSDRKEKKEHRSREEYRIENKAEETENDCEHIDNCEYTDDEDENRD